VAAARYSKAGGRCCASGLTRSSIHRGFGATVAERYAHIPLLAGSGLMRMSLFDPGSVNLGAVGDDGVPGGAFDFVYLNISRISGTSPDLCEQYRLAPSHRDLRPGFLRATLAYAAPGACRRAPSLKLYFGGDHDYMSGTAGG